MMKPSPSEELERRLVEVLADEARTANPSPDAWSALQRKIRAAEFPAPRDRRRRRSRVAVAAVVALAVVVAATLVVVSGGMYRDARPDPARTPGTATFAPITARVAWTVYRAGQHGSLVQDAARASAPYDPRQALTALFEQPASAPGVVEIAGNGRNRVASLVSAGNGIRLDMSAVDEVSRPSGPDAAKQARLWVEAWVRTAQEALSDYGPVVITLNGKPTTLYGSVDTTQPLVDRDGLSESPEQPVGVYFPRAGEQVTSPVAIAAMPGGGRYDLLVTDLDSGASVFQDRATNGSERQEVLTELVDLPAARYQVLLRPAGAAAGSGAERRADFTVTGPGAAAATRSPVSNPPTGPLARTLVYFPASGPDRLIAEPQPRTTLEAAVLAAGSEPSSNDASWPFGGAKLGSVTERKDRVVVDYTAMDDVLPVKDPDTATAQLWAQGLVHTVAAYLGTPKPVQVTLAGRPFRLFKRLDTREPFALRAVPEQVSTGLSEPLYFNTATAPLPVLGSVEHPVPSVTWYLLDLVTHETLYRGTTPVEADQTFGFTLPLPPGRYSLRVDEPATGATRRTIGSTTTVVG